MTVKCGENTSIIHKAACGSKSYDPAQKFCYEGELYEYCNGKTYDVKNFKCHNNEIVFEDERDSEIYKVATIGKQTWLAENLRYRLIFNRSGSAKADSGSFCFDDDLPDCKKGRFYTWAAAMDSVNQGSCGYGKTCTPLSPYHRGVCPKGWHLPTKQEATNLLRFICDDQLNSWNNCHTGNYLKSQSGWEDDMNGTDDYGFSALPMGYQSPTIGYNYVENAVFWTSTVSTDNDKDFSYRFGIRQGQTFFTFETSEKNYGYLVRCLLDSN